MDDEDLKELREDFERGHKRQKAFNVLFGILDLSLIVFIIIYIAVSSK